MFNFFKKRPIEEKKIEPLRKKPDFDNVDSLIEYFKKETGIDFTKKADTIKRKFTYFCRNRGIDDFNDCLFKVKNTKELKQDLINYLTVNETYFFREMSNINKMVDIVKQSKHKVDILCAPSSTGAEPYTIAISLLEKQISKDKFQIDGIDINSQTIELSKNGIYSDRDLHRVPLDIKTKYFTLVKDKYHLNDNIKNLVNFTTANVFDKDFLQIGKYDIISSCNMLIYFDDKTKLKTKAIFEKILKNKNGHIFFGHADMPYIEKN